MAEAPSLWDDPTDKGLFIAACVLLGIALIIFIIMLLKLKNRKDDPDAPRQMFVTRVIKKKKEEAEKKKRAKKREKNPEKTPTDSSSMSSEEGTTKQTEQPKTQKSRITSLFSQRSTKTKTKGATSKTKGAPSSTRTAQSTKIEKSKAGSTKQHTDINVYIVDKRADENSDKTGSTSKQATGSTSKQATGSTSKQATGSRSKTGTQAKTAGDSRFAKQAKSKNHQDNISTSVKHGKTVSNADSASRGNTEASGATSNQTKQNTTIVHTTADSAPVLVSHSYVRNPQQKEKGLKQVQSKAKKVEQMKSGTKFDSARKTASKAKGGPQNFNDVGHGSELKQSPSGRGVKKGAQQSVDAKATGKKDAAIATSMRD